MGKDEIEYGGKRGRMPSLFRLAINACALGQFWEQDQFPAFRVLRDLGVGPRV